MNYSESLSRIKRNVNPTFWSEEDIEHYKNIVNALEKQIPKKPVFYETGYICPCGSYVKVRKRYCGTCGQALDWGDKE